MSGSSATSCSSPVDSADDTDLETYLLLLLSDSNLPTGGFVASSGLESFHAHGLLHNARPTPDLAKYGHSSSSFSTQIKKTTLAPSQAQLSSATLSFAQSTLHSYARSSFGFLARAHAVATHYLEQCTHQARQDAKLQECLAAITRLDSCYHTLLLNHVARRASKAQGIALLTLYSKAFAKPINLDGEPFNAHKTDDDAATKHRIELAAGLVDTFKMDIRRSSTRAAGCAEAVHGHLPICWAVFAACLGIGLNKAVYLHLFLQARSLFSSSIRLNTLGPYLAHQIMRFQMRRVVESVMNEMEEVGCLNIGHIGVGEDKVQGEQEMDVETVEAYTIDDRPAQPTTPTTRRFRTTATMSTATTCRSSLRPPIQPVRIGKGQLIPVDDNDPNQGWAWDWPEEQDLDRTNQLDSETGFWTQPWAPATTFPLGEIVQARHDQLHSRLFNS